MFDNGSTLTFSNIETVIGGTQPDGLLNALKLGIFGTGEGALPDIVWDGDLDDAKLVDGEPVAGDRICAPLSAASSPAR